MRVGQMASRHQRHLDLLTPCRPLRELQRRHAQWQAHEATQQAEVRRQAVAEENARVSAVSTLLGSTFASPVFGASALQSLCAAHAALDARARVAANSLDSAQREVDARSAEFSVADAALSALDRNLAAARRRRLRQLDELALLRADDARNAWKRST